MKKRGIIEHVPNKDLEAYRRPKIKARMSNRFFKSFFSVNDVCFANSPNKVQQGTIAATMRPMIEAYQRITRQRTDWKCHESALDGSVLSKTTAMSTLMQRQPTTLNYEPVRDEDDAAGSSSGDEDRELAKTKQRRILVPITGGLSSLACLWYALQQKDACVYLCYVSGMFGSNLAGEMRALMQLVRYARDQNGIPFVENPENPAGEVVYHPHTRFKVLCMPSQPYRYPDSACVDQLTPDFAGPVHENPHDSRPNGACPDEQTGMKHHPLSYIMLYRVLLDAAQAWQCNSIVFGAYGQAKELLEATSVCFNTIMHHDLVFPFDHRTDALYALQEASVRSSQIWKSVREQQQKHQPKDGAGSTNNDSSSARGRRGSSSSRLSSSAAVTGGTKGKKSTFDVVWTTPGPSLMPDVSHYAWTCRGASQLPDVLQQSEVARSTTEEREKDRQMLQNSQVETDKESAKEGKAQTKRKRGLSKSAVTTPITKRFLEEFYARRNHRGNNLFNWCGNCIDCYMWRSVSWLWHRSVSISSSSTAMNAPSEYITLLTEGYWRYLSERRLLAHVKHSEAAVQEDNLLEQMFCPRNLDESIDEEGDGRPSRANKKRKTLRGADAVSRYKSRKLQEEDDEDDEDENDEDDGLDEEEDQDVEDEEEYGVEEEEGQEYEDEDEDEEEEDFDIAGANEKENQVGAEHDEDDNEEEEEEEDESEDEEDGNEFYNDLDDDGFVQDAGADDYYDGDEDADDQDIDYD